MNTESLEEGLIRELAATMQMVQVICITIDGVKVMCLGPVLHVPPAGLFVGDVQEIEFGELVPSHLAAKLLDGEYSKSMGVQ
jgi:hypothetical protein